jgi:signal transduction histidine kinase/CheY-like chemotaxis protein
MAPAAGYATVAAARSREIASRLGLAAFIGIAAFVLSPSIWPVVWFAVVVCSQFIDRAVALHVMQFEAETPRGQKALYLASVFTSTALYAAISPYFWFAGGVAGGWFALLLAAGGLVHVSVRSYASRWVLIAGGAPHALALFCMPVCAALLKQGLGFGATTVVVIGAALYLVQLVAGVRQSQNFVANLHEANEAANAARDLAERASAAKSEFLATVSHEIRTPMNAVLSAAHLLKRTDLTPTQDEHVAMLTNGGEVLVGLLNDVLDISKIEAGKMVLEEADLDLDEVLDALIKLYAPRAEAKGVALLLEAGADTPSAVRTDPLRLRQILFNLLSNAVKFTDAGTVTLRAGRHFAGAAEWLWFEVEDSGIGIDKEAMGRLFGSFEQAKAETARQHGGTGLGLAISRKLAEMMGGSLTCESVLGKGSTFRLELPLIEAAHSVAVEDEVGIDLSTMAPLSILVAEDHEVNRKIVGLFLEPLGWRLTFAKDGGEAVEMAAVTVYDAILMDMQMPVMGGIEAGLTIRHSGGPNADTPIIALTANALGHHRDAWEPVGAAAFLTKPINPDLLVETLVMATVGRPAQMQAANAA